MTPERSREFGAILGELVELSTDVRLGQLLANLGFLAEARAGTSLWEIEDERLLALMVEHRDELADRAEPAVR